MQWYILPVGGGIVHNQCQREAFFFVNKGQLFPLGGKKVQTHTDTQLKSQRLTMCVDRR